MFSFLSSVVLSPLSSSKGLGYHLFAVVHLVQADMLDSAPSHSPHWGQWGERRQWHLLIVLQSEYVQQGSTPHASKLTLVQVGNGWQGSIPQSSQCLVGNRRGKHRWKLPFCKAEFFSIPKVFLFHVSVYLTFPYTVHYFFSSATPTYLLRFRSEFISSSSCCTLSSAAVEVKGCMMRKFLGEVDLCSKFNHINKHR